MNSKIQKINDEIERTKAKIAELQALLPELERKRTDAENTEILRLVRSANIAPGEIAAFVESIKSGRQDSRQNDGRLPLNNGAAPPAIKKEEVSENDQA